MRDVTAANSIDAVRLSAFAQFRGWFFFVDYRPPSQSDKLPQTDHRLSIAADFHLTKASASIHQAG